MYQSARSVYCRYPGVKSKGVELVYDLTEKPLLFLDEGLVYPGMIIWTSRDGDPHPLHAGIEYYGETRLHKEEVVGREFRTPSGVAFEVQPANAGPLIDTWHGAGTATIRYEGGVYRCWMNSKLSPEERRAIELSPQLDNESNGYDLASASVAVRYLESDDGVSWRVPEFSFVRLGGRGSNIVHGPMFVHGRSYSGLQVFYDPSGRADERYKGTFTGHSLSSRQLIDLCARRGINFDPMALQIDLSRLPRVRLEQKGLYEIAVGGRLPSDPRTLPNVRAMVVYGATSPDGIRWRAIDEPIMPFMCETGDAFYDIEKGRYVNYVRYWQRGQRRNIGISETIDFHQWPPPRPLVCPGLNEALTTDYYTSCHTLYPGTTDVHFFFISKFHHGDNDCVDLWLASSLDGDVFEFVPGGPVVACDPEGWDTDRAVPAACVFPIPHLVPFGPRHVGLIVREDNMPHKWPRTTQWRHTFRWALWERERLVALRASSHGQFTTAGLMLERPDIFVNVRTEPSGTMKAQLLDDSGQPVAGCTFDQADAVNGDHLRARLTWSGQRAPAALIGRKVYLQFQLTRTRLFSLSAGGA